MSDRAMNLRLLVVALFAITASCIILPNHGYRLDTAGNLLDSHDGKLYHFEDKYYFYGTSYSCGFRWRTADFTSPFCGFKSYSSTDLLTWEDEGFLFDAQTEYWQTMCADVAACFRPKVLKNPKSNEYIMWMNSGSSKYSYTVFNSSSPTGPFVQVGQPVMPYGRGNTSYGNGDFGIHIGPDGTGYIAFDTTPYVSGPSLFASPNITYGIVQRLTPDYKATEEAYVVTDLTNIEAWDIWYRNGWWYLSFGHICGYCDATDTSYIKSRDPLGPWREADRVRITDSSCNGQHNMVAKLPRAQQHDEDDDFVWLYGSDNWIGQVNEGKAGSHWEPLKFQPDGSIEPLDCYAPSYDVPVKTTTPKVESVMDHAAVKSGPGNYTWSCNLGVMNHNFLWQFFRAPKSGNVTAFGVNIAQQANNYPLDLSLSRVRNIEELFTPKGGVDSLWSDSFAVDSLGWALPMLTVKPNVTVKEGEYYSISASTTGGTVPYCYMYRSIEKSRKRNHDEPADTFMAEIQQGKYPLFPLEGKEMSFYVHIE